MNQKIETLKKKHKIIGTTICINSSLENNQTLCFGELSVGGDRVDQKSWFEFASLSKSVATAFSLEVFLKNNISLDSKVNEVLKKYNSSYFIEGEWCDLVEIHHLMSHCALNMHYVNGVPANKKMPHISQFLNENNDYGYEKICVINKPGTLFKYSGAGFILLEYLVELITGKLIVDSSKSFLLNLEMYDFSFENRTLFDQKYAHGYYDNKVEVEGGRKIFPSFAAGAMGTPLSMNNFLSHLSKAYHLKNGSKGISHNTAVQMLYGKDLGSIEFMNAKMGLGIFCIEGGDNTFAIHQGANDGFRSLFVYCYKGPDYGKGFTIQSIGEKNAMLFNANIAQVILKELEVKGLDWSLIEHDFSFNNIKEEEIVNLGYKDLLFKAFVKQQSEAIDRQGETCEISTLLIQNKLKNSTILKVSNEKFARVENLFSFYRPHFDPKLFGKQGKVMDSWESVRHNLKSSDYVILKASNQFCPHFAYISTEFHLGNQVEYLCLYGKKDLNNNDEWILLIDKLKVKGHSYQLLKLDNSKNDSYLYFKIEIFPDGGLTRLALFENCPENMNELMFDNISKPFDNKIPSVLKPQHIPFKKNKLDIEVLSATDEHYAPASQVLSPYEPLSMFDGFESGRSREFGHHEEIHFKLKEKKMITGFEFNFEYFVNNNPMSIRIKGLINQKWRWLTNKTDVKAYAGNLMSISVNQVHQILEFKVYIYPDGGFNRIRVLTK